MVDDSSLNVSVIQAYDQFCTQVIDKSSSAHVYSFKKESKSWVKSKIGGVFFLYKRSKVPFYSFMVLNRKSPNLNQIEMITPALQLQLHSPFLLYKTSRDDIFSIWFFSPEDCVRIAEELGKIVFDLGGAGLRIAAVSEVKTRSSVQKNAAPEAVTNGLTQLISFIRRSGDSDEKFMTQNQISTQANLLKRTSKSNGIQQLGPTSPETPNLLDMLRKAKMDFTTSGPHNSGLDNDQNIDTELQRLRTVCHITPTTSGSSLTSDKLCSGIPTSVSNPGIVIKPSSSMRNESHISVAELEQQLLREHVKVPVFIAGDEGTDDSSSEERGRSRPVPLRPVPLIACKTDEIRSTDHSQPSRLLSDLDAGYADDVDETYEEDSHPQNSGLLVAEKSSACCRAGMVQRKQRRHRHHENSQSHDEQTLHAFKLPNFTPESFVPMTVQNREEAEGNDDLDEPLVTPAMLSSVPSASAVGLTVNMTTRSPAASPRPADPLNIATNGSYSDKNETVDGLTKEQLRDALVHLLQNDSGFLHQIHAAYMATLQSRITS
ncbi:unnamed protein product [Calicophoron daubneyi]|uniref:mRNA-decapping enzyme C-terminal domain-containing protein n=1 Tax=Calicophoron daubneyi TaxID=300641 RepID=A0AAV2TCT2_CALDB